MRADQNSLASGEGFMSDGSRLGGSHGVPQHIGRIKGFEAAEKRAQKQRLMGPGGKLGGANAVRPNKTPRELAAEVRKLLALPWYDEQADRLHLRRCTGGGTKAKGRQALRAR